jgi:hypothetical protein
MFSITSGSSMQARTCPASNANALGMIRSAFMPGDLRA